MGSVCIT